MPHGPFARIPPKVSIRPGMWNVLQAALENTPTIAETATIDGPLQHRGTTAGFYNTTPIVKPSANPDTTGATLGALETEVNELKAMLRSLGLLTP